MTPSNRLERAHLSSGLRPYAVGLVAVALVTAARVPFEPWLQGRAPYALYYLPVLYVAWSAGILPTIATAIFSLLAAKYFFIPVERSFAFGPGEIASMALFLVSASAMTLLSRKASGLRESAARSEQACRRAERSARAAVWEWDSRADAFESVALAGLFGVAEGGELSAGALEAVVHPEDRSRFRQGLADAAKSSTPVRTEFRVQHPTHGLRWLASIGEMSGRGKDSLWVSGLTLDITGRVESDHAAAEQREWFRKTLESIGDAVLACDVDGRVVFMNKVAERLTGKPLEAARGQASAEVLRLVDERTRAPIESPVSRALREGTAVKMNARALLLSSEGGERPIEDSSAPIRMQGGEVVGVVVVFRDISERRQAEKEREGFALEREGLLASERAARTDAQRANRLKDEFVGTLSHELRTPLNAILGWVHVLQMEGSEAEALAQGLAVIERNTRVQAQLVSDLLDMTSILSGKLHLALESVEVAKVVDAALETLKPSLDAKRIAVAKHLEPQLRVVVDPARLQQIIWNLLSNAAKFTPEGGRIEVAARRADASVEFAVRDNGIGIRPEFLTQVFERFRQGDGSTTRRYGGLGLGLAIVKQLVELHGGSIAAESAGEGRGATFRFRLPSGAVAPQRIDQDGEAGSRRLLHVARERLKQLRILVVEDEDDTRDLVQRLLQECGADVSCMPSATEALPHLIKSPPDILISDIGLPGMDGYSLIQHLRRSTDPRLARLPAIALTAFARLEDRAEALQAGYQAHLIKPVEPAELIAAIASLAGLVVQKQP